MAGVHRTANWPLFSVEIWRTFLSYLQVMRDGIDYAVATRLMALARPEACVSVNGESVRGLAEYTGHSANLLRTARGYGKLIAWVMAGKWWNVPEPSESDERALWFHRGALIDGIAYAGHQLSAARSIQEMAQQTKGLRGVL